MYIPVEYYCTCITLIALLQYSIQSIIDIGHSGTSAPTQTQLMHHSTSSQWHYHDNAWLSTPQTSLVTSCVESMRPYECPQSTEAGIMASFPYHHQALGHHSDTTTRVLWPHFKWQSFCWDSQLV